MHGSFFRLRYVGAAAALAVACGHVEHRSSPDRPASGGESSTGGTGISLGNGGSGGSSNGNTSGGSSTGGMVSAAGSAGAPPVTGGRAGSGSDCPSGGLFRSCFNVETFDDPDHVPHFALGGAGGAGPGLGDTEVCPAAEALNWEPGERDLCHVSFATGPVCPSVDGTTCCYEVHYSCE